MPTPKSKPGKPSKPPRKATSPRRPSPAANGKRAPRERTVFELAEEYLAHPQEWMRTANPQFGDRRPIDLVGTDEEIKVRNLFMAAELGLY